MHCMSVCARVQRLRRLYNGRQCSTASKIVITTYTITTSTALPDLVMIMMNVAYSVRVFGRASLFYKHVSGSKWVHLNLKAGKQLP